MATITIHSDFGAQENKICHCFYFFPFSLSWSDRIRCHDLSFLNAEFQASFFHSSLSPSSRGCLVPLHFIPLEDIIIGIYSKGWCLLQGAHWILMESHFPIVCQHYFHFFTFQLSSVMLWESFYKVFSFVLFFLFLKGFLCMFNL